MILRSKRRPAVQSCVGFTTVEMAVAMLLTVLIFSAAAALYVNGIDMMRYGEVSAESSAAVRRALAAVVRDVRSASSVVASASIGGTVYTSDANTLVLKLPSSDGSQLRFTHFDYVAYDVSNGALVRAVQPASGAVRPGGTQHLIPLGVTSVSIAYYRIDGSATSNWNEVANVRFRITLSRNSQKGPVTVTEAQRASLMNFGLSEE